MAFGGTRVPNATAGHVRLSGTTGMLLPQRSRGDNSKPLEGEWNIVPTYDGTNNCVALNTATAIT